MWRAGGPASVELPIPGGQSSRGRAQPGRLGAPGTIVTLLRLRSILKSRVERSRLEEMPAYIAQAMTARHSPGGSPGQANGNVSPLPRNVPAVRQWGKSPSIAKHSSLEAQGVQAAGEAADRPQIFPPPAWLKTMGHPLGQRLHLHFFFFFFAKLGCPNASVPSPSVAAHRTAPRRGVKSDR
jgi:hypothetical protein